MDGWIVCPKCLTAMVGQPGEICLICKTAMVETPLYPDDDPDLEPSEQVSELLLWDDETDREYDGDYDESEQAILDELLL